MDDYPFECQKPESRKISFTVDITSYRMDRLIADGEFLSNMNREFKEALKRSNNNGYEFISTDGFITIHGVKDEA